MTKNADGSVILNVTYEMLERMEKEECKKIELHPEKLNNLENQMIKGKYHKYGFLEKDELNIVKKIMPLLQYVGILKEIITSEDRWCYQMNLKALVETYKKLSANSAFHFNPKKFNKVMMHYSSCYSDTEFYVTELHPDGVFFGYVILGGYYELAEWGRFSLSQIFSVPGMGIDFLNIREPESIDSMLHFKTPEIYPENKSVIA